MDSARWLGPRRWIHSARASGRTSKRMLSNMARIIRGKRVAFRIRQRLVQRWLGAALGATLGSRGLNSFYCFCRGRGRSSRNC